MDVAGGLGVSLALAADRDGGSFGCDLVFRLRGFEYGSNRGGF